MAPVEDAGRVVTMIRRRIFFTGRVQGVGFRYTTTRLARGFEVAGYVRNLPDGRVEAVIEGEAAEVERFQRAIRDEMSHCIADVTHQDTAATGGFRGFEVRF
ncbi:MAG: acylphosphatase [Phycisphaerae bacterium]